MPHFGGLGGSGGRQKHKNHAQHEICPPIGRCSPPPGPPTRQWPGSTFVDKALSVGLAGQLFLLAIKPRTESYNSSFLLFRSFPGQTWPRDVLQRAKL